MQDLQDAALLDAALTGSGSPDTAETQAPQEPAQQAGQYVSDADAGYGDAQPEQQEPPVDWEARFRGLSRRYNQDRRQLDELSAQVMHYEDLLIDQVTQDLPEDERDYHQQMLYMAAHARRAEEAARQQAMMNQEMMRAQTIRNLAESYGVPPHELMLFDDPQSMHLHARRVSALMQQANHQQRRQSGADRFEGAGAGTAWQEPTTEDEGADAFVRELRQMGVQF